MDQKIENILNEEILNSENDEIISSEDSLISDDFDEILQQYPCKTKIAKVIEDISKISELNAQFKMYNVVTPISFGIEKALHIKNGSIYIAYPILIAQGLQTTSNLAAVISNRLGCARTADCTKDMARSRLPSLLFALGLSTKLNFIVAPLFNRASALTQAVSVPVGAMALAFGGVFGLPKIIQCTQKKPNSSVNKEQKAITRWQIAGQVICNTVNSMGTVSGILNLLSLQKDTIFPFMENISNSKLFYISLGLGSALGGVNALTHTSRSQFAQVISDHIIMPINVISQEFLEVFYFWFQILAMVVINEDNHEIPDEIFWNVTYMSIAFCAIKIALGLGHYFLNDKNLRQEERAKFYPMTSHEMNDFFEEEEHENKIFIEEKEGGVMSNKDDDSKEDIQEKPPEETLEEDMYPTIIIGSENFSKDTWNEEDVCEEYDEEDMSKNDDIYRYVSQPLLSLSFFSYGADKFTKKIREYNPEICQIL